MQMSYIFFIEVLHCYIIQLMHTFAVKMRIYQSSQECKVMFTPALQEYINGFVI